MMYRTPSVRCCVVVSKGLRLTLTTRLQAARVQFNTDRTLSPSGSPSASGWLFIVATGWWDATMPVGGGQTARKTGSTFKTNKHDTIYDCIHAGIYLSLEEAGLYWMAVGPGDCRVEGSRVGYLRRHGWFSLTCWQEKWPRARGFSPESAAGTALLFRRFLCGPRAWSPYDNWGGSFQPRSWLPVQHEQGQYRDSKVTQHQWSTTDSRVKKCLQRSRSQD